MSVNALKRICLLGTAALLLNACGSQPLTLPSPSELLGKHDAAPSAPSPVAPAPSKPVPANPVPEPDLDTASLPTALSLRVGESRQLTPTIGGQVPASGRLTWQSSDTSIVSVTAGGVLSAHQPGQARVQITEAAHPERGFALSVQVQPDPPAQTIQPVPAPVPAPSPAPAPAPPPAPAPAPKPAPAPPPAQRPHQIRRPSRPQRLRLPRRQHRRPRPAAALRRKCCA